MSVTNKTLNDQKEENCIGVTFERKYYHADKSFVKRTLRPREWQLNYEGKVHVPRQGQERAWNEAAALKLVAEKSTIPVPSLYCCFEDDEAVYLVTEYVEGVGMDELTDSQKEVVKKELEVHVQTMHALRACQVGGPSGLVVPPYRVTLKSSNDRITTIIDWEYAGFYPEFFERHFLERKAPSAALDGEEDETEKLIEFLHAQMAKADVDERLSVLPGYT
ncbi:MAG: hypothetical protein M1837_006702 [Sclerophora amabilis]|nr:MAG: hypothetical protein M1837_006702 [Sclerophora amabilis]